LVNRFTEAALRCPERHITRIVPPVDIYKNIIILVGY
jgi:hypothetical protein